ncbi:MAG: NUDIX hydrolase [Anaerolineales bacterium]|nr:NUDIX hydrolase [Anaerolineales bacterium]MCB8953885.1 NUDIX hydrolase [Ardenticatenales bacterium]
MTPASRSNSPARVLWDGPSWQFCLRQITLPDGQTLEKGIIDHPGSVLMVPLQGDQVLLLRQYRLALDEVILELPAGTRHPDESWLACAQRELREETGYRANSFTSLGEIWLAPGLSNERMALFLATDLAPDPLPGDVDEEIEVISMPLTAAVQMALSGQMRDAKSIVALLRVAYFRQNQG